MKPSPSASLALVTLAAFGALLTGCGGDDGGAGAGQLAGGAGGAPPGGGTGSEAGGTGGAVPEGPVPTLPAPTGACPTFSNGMVTFTVGGAPREAKIWIDDAAAAASDGPLVLYWYGTAGSPDQVETAAVSNTGGLGPEQIARITSMGGIVVAPVHINHGTFPWIQANGEDYPFTDEIVACAEAGVGIDERHIHSMGFSAGGLFTAQLGYARASYLASVATYSGGGGSPDTNQDPSNPFAAMILFGGANDTLVLSFQAQSQAYYDDLTAAGHFAFMCDHGGGHSIPEDARSSVVQFFLDHPYRTAGEPYAGGLPAGFPSYCAL